MQKTALPPHAVAPYSVFLLWVVIKDSTNNTNNNNTIKICNNFMSCIFMFCIFISCYLVRHFHVLSVRLERETRVSRIPGPQTGGHGMSIKSIASF